MPRDITNEIATIKAALVDMTENQRLEVFAEIAEDWCDLCGTDVRTRFCYCAPCYDE